MAISLLSANEWPSQLLLRACVVRVSCVVIEECMVSGSELECCKRQSVPTFPLLGWLFFFQAWCSPRHHRILRPPQAPGGGDCLQPGL
jgi:hypothetical protein